MSLTPFPRPRIERELSALDTSFFIIKPMSIKLKIIIFIFSKIRIILLIIFSNKISVFVHSVSVVVCLFSAFSFKISVF